MEENFENKIHLTLLAKGNIFIHSIILKAQICAYWKIDF